MLFISNLPYNLRYRHSVKRKAVPDQHYVQKKRLRHYDHINSLPDEVLLHIFSYIHFHELYFNVRPVCRRWKFLALAAESWQNVYIGREIPTNIVVNWIKSSPVIRHLKIRDRDDMDIILEEVTKNCVHLQNILVDNCWGSKQKIYLDSSALCKLLTRCKKLSKINFERVKIRSCKFFKLLANRRNNGKFLQLCYVGPVTSKQFQALRESSSGWIFTEFVEIEQNALDVIV